MYKYVDNVLYVLSIKSIHIGVHTVYLHINKYIRKCHFDSSEQKGTFKYIAKRKKEFLILYKFSEPANQYYYTKVSQLNSSFILCIVYVLHAQSLFVGNGDREQINFTEIKKKKIVFYIL